MSLLPYAAYVSIGRHVGARVEVTESSLHDLIRFVLRDVAFDESWYRGRYHDVVNAIERGEYETGRDHYLQVGYFEGRMPRRIPVDDEWYTNSYADISAAIRQGAVECGQDHFERYGFAEGRLPKAGWTL